MNPLTIFLESGKLESPAEPRRKGNMLFRIIKTSIALFIFLFCNLFYLSAQEKQDAREEAMQSSLEREGTYSQSPQQEATSGLKKVTPITTPPAIEFMEKVQKEQERALVPGSQAQGGTPQKVTPIISPSVLEFMEKVQKEHEKTLVPAPKSSQELLSFKEKLEKEEKEKKEKAEEEKAGEEKEGKKAELTAIVVEPQPALETTEEREYYIDLGDIMDISVWELPVSQGKLAEQKTKEKKGEEYYIDLGDTLDISVWQVPDLSRADVIVRPDGKISFSLIGDIKAEGLTLTQLDGIVTEKLKEYVKNPEVSIMIRNFGRSGAGVKGIGKIGEAVVRSALSQS
ncbi:MAG: polysaccharide biosynthesis/export family protein, partial [Candidatus Omnitrophica bacterium]|nr:polysaccharide biosynthesis/export family protein [Candidatus Omnitrophota bacterium]